MLVVVFLFFLLVNHFNSQKIFSLQNYVQGEYTAYTNKKVAEKSIYLGTCYMVSGKVNEKDSIVGESVKSYNLEVGKFLKDLDATVVANNYIESGVVVISAFSPKIKNKVKENGRWINLQIASYEDYTIVGWPVILGSF